MCLFILIFRGCYNVMGCANKLNVLKRRHTISTTILWHSYFETLFIGRYVLIRGTIRHVTKKVDYVLLLIKTKTLFHAQWFTNPNLGRSFWTIIIIFLLAAMITAQSITILFEVSFVLCFSRILVTDFFF